jgi:hypothetical protein
LTGRYSVLSVVVNPISVCAKFLFFSMLKWKNAYKLQPSLMEYHSFVLEILQICY